MRNFIFVTFLLITPLMARADLHIFSCEPEWAALAQELGADKVKTHSATNALQDPHYVQARPSLIAQLRQADLVVCTGAQLEIGWLPMLLRKGNNPGVLPGSTGFLEASRHVKRLGVTASSDRSQGDVHPQGNPHIQTNPHNILLVAEVMTKRMVQLDAENSKFYQQQLSDFRQRWSRAIAGWEDRGRVLRGKRVITHHNSWIYMVNWLRMEEAAMLEPVSGIPPTTGHLTALLARFNGNESADFIVRAPYQSEKPSNWLAERTGIPAVLLPLTVGGTDDADSLFSFFDAILDRLTSAGD